MKNHPIHRYHALELPVTERGGLVRFQYKMPELTGTITGIVPLIMGTMPRAGHGKQVGMLTLEALDRKIHLATLPVMSPDEIGQHADFYPVREELSEGRLVNGSYVDYHKPNEDFTPYRLKVLFRVRI